MLELFELGLRLFESGFQGGELAGGDALQVQGEGVVFAGDGVVGATRFRLYPWSDPGFYPDPGFNPLTRLFDDMLRA